MSCRYSRLAEFKANAKELARWGVVGWHPRDSSTPE